MGPCGRPQDKDCMVIASQNQISNVLVFCGIKNKYVLRNTTLEKGHKSD